MITPSFALTATERVLPKLALDFTTASLDARVTFTRTGNTATVTNSSGNIVGINANLPRFDFNPTTLVCRGLLIEESRANALLNSLIDGTDLATQLVTVTAAARTLSFYGTGTVVLSGAHSATVVGTGAYPTRTTLTFTPSAGVLTLTVTGTVQFAQLEAGAFATSFIPTAALAVTRNADVATMTGTNFSSWYNQSEGSFQVNAAPIAATTLSALTVFQNGSNFAGLAMGSVNVPRLLIFTAGAYVVNASAGSAQTSPFKQAFALKTGSVSFASNTTLNANNLNQTVPTAMVDLRIGFWIGGGSYANAHMQQIYYYPQKLLNAELQSITK